MHCCDKAPNKSFETTIVISAMSRALRGESGEYRLGTVACVRSRQVSLHTSQVSLTTKRVSPPYAREFGTKSGLATIPSLDALRGYNDVRAKRKQ